MTASWNRETLLEQSATFQESRILITAAELDLFTALEDRPKTVDELAAAHGWDARALRILMDALAALGILSKSSDTQYNLPQHLANLLSSNAAESILPMILHRGSMWQTWSHLTEVVRTGNNPNPMGSGSRPRKEMEDFIGAMHVVGRELADTIAGSVDLGLYRRMLDIGGGSGTYTMAFLKRAPHMTATLFDRLEVVEMARKRLTDAGFISRVDLVAGDYNTDELPKGHDLALLSAIIHSNSRAQNLDMFRRIHRCLEQRGTILIRDHFMDSSRTCPKAGAIFAVNMLCATQAGDSHALADVLADLETAGFKDVRMTREGQDMDQLVAATKE